MDPLLSGVGLNKNDCIKNGFGATFCGDDAEAYQQQVGQIATGLGAATGSVSEEQASAQANVRASIPAIETYAADNGGSGYAGMSIAALQAIDRALTDIVITSATASSYCVQNTVGTQTYSYQQGGATGVNGVITPGAC